MTQSTPELLPVVQADRDAAADLSEAKGDPGFNALAMRQGAMDLSASVQAFAKHRIEHSTPDRSAVLEGLSEHFPTGLRSKRGVIVATGEVFESPIQCECWCGASFAGSDEQEVRQLWAEHVAALTTTPEPTDPAGMSEMGEARDILSGLSSYLGAGLGDDSTTLAQYDDRIRWGIDHIGSVYRNRAAQVVEECSKRPGTTWGKVKRAILDDTCLPTASGREAPLRTPPVLEVAKEALERLVGVVERLTDAIERQEQDIGGESVDDTPEGITARANHYATTPFDPIEQEINRILFRRCLQERVAGYVNEAAEEIAQAVKIVLAALRQPPLLPSGDEVRRQALEEAAKVADDQAQRCRDIIATCPKWSPVQGEWSRARDACLDTAEAIRALSPSDGLSTADEKD